jgi:hypothetical protein
MENDTAALSWKFRKTSIKEEKTMQWPKTEWVTLTALSKGTALAVP